MKKITALVLALCLCAALAGCSGGAYERSGDGLSVVTTVFPAFDFAREIALDNAEICLIVPPGSEAHSFEPSAQDILKISSCDLFIYNGGESEAWVEEILSGLDGEVNSLAMTDCVETLEEEVKEGMQTAGEEEEHGGHGHEDGAHEPEYDEHVWTSPVNAEKISAAICEKLSEADPANAAAYEARLSAYAASLRALDAQFRDIVENASLDTLVFADRFPVRYFVEEYALEYYAAFPGCAENAEPSARTVAFLIDRVREEKLPAVFYIEFSNEKMADIICEDTGCAKLLFHSCHNVSRDELLSGVTYLDLMRGNAAALKEALG